MKKLTILMTIIIITVLLAGCLPGPKMETIEEVQIKIIGIEQEAYCGSKSEELMMVKCGHCCPPCICPDCPACDTCCPECETCEVCETCQTCPEIPECPNCPCYGLKWGNLFIDLQIENKGTDYDIVPEVCIEITFEDGTKIKRCAKTEIVLSVDELRFEKIKYKLPKPIKRVIFAGLVEEIVK